MKQAEYLCRRLMDGAEQGTAIRRQLPHRPHQSSCTEGVQSRRGLVTEQQRRVGQQLDTVRSVTSDITVLRICRNILHRDKFPEDRSGSLLHAVCNNLQQCFPKLLLADTPPHKRGGGITRDPHILAHVNTERPDVRRWELQMYVSELISHSHHYIPVVYVMTQCMI